MRKRENKICTLMEGDGLALSTTVNASSASCSGEFWKRNLERRDGEMERWRDGEGREEGEKGGEKGRREREERKRREKERREGEERKRGEKERREGEERRRGKKERREREERRRGEKERREGEVEKGENINYFIFFQRKTCQPFFMVGHDILWV
jgi:hypothetical protein